MRTVMLRINHEGSVAATSPKVAPHQSDGHTAHVAVDDVPADIRDDEVAQQYARLMFLPAGRFPERVPYSLIAGRNQGEIVQLPTP